MVLELWLLRLRLPETWKSVDALDEPMCLSCPNTTFRDTSRLFQSLTSEERILVGGEFWCNLGGRAIWVEFIIPFSSSRSSNSARASHIHTNFMENPLPFVHKIPIFWETKVSEDLAALLSREA